jgi:Na+/glutamate symporter
MRKSELIWAVAGLLVLALYGSLIGLLTGFMIGGVYAVYLWTEPQRKAAEKAEKEAKEMTKAPQRIAEQRQKMDAAVERARRERGM